jgi:TonB-linked SusC/RagA family outer membrane protein
MIKTFPVPTWICQRVRLSSLLFVVLTYIGAVTQSYALEGKTVLEKKISLEVKSVKLKRVLAMLESKADVRFVYSPNAIDVHQSLSLSVTNERLGGVLKKLLTPLAIDFEVSDDKMISLNREDPQEANLTPPLAQPPTSKDTEVSGVVKDENGEPIPGVNVVIKGSQTGTVTDPSGAFRLMVPDQSSVLVFSFVGYTTQEIVVGTQTVLALSLAVDQKSLEEVVVVGYGTQKKSDLTGSVSVVDMKQLQKMPATNLGQQLQGRAAGVTVGSQGAPGSPTMIRIRGIGTVNNNGPLYVIDGVSTRDQNLNSINPNDIESVQVLKDASSASIYGAQASNGVIIITTKKGKSGKPQVNYETFYSISTPNKAYDLLDSRERIGLMWESKLNAAEIRKVAPNLAHPQFGDGMSPVYPKYIIPQASNGDFTPNDWTETNRITRFSEGTDWYKESTRQAVTKSHQLTFSGANESVNYLFGLNYLNQDGIFNHTFYKRYSARVNTEIKVNRKVRVGENLTINFSRNNTFEDQSEGNIVSWSYRMNPWLPVHDITGRFAGTKANGSGNAQNPVAILQRRKDNYNNFLRIFGNFYLDADLLPSLKFRTSLGIDNTRSNFYAMQKLDPEFSETQGRNQLSEGSNFNLRYVWSNTLNYTKQFGEKHHLTALGGTEFVRDGIGRSMNATRYGYLFEDNVSTWTLANGGTRDLNNTSAWNGEMALFGIFGRVDYAYDNRYLLTGIVRRDGSSKFSQANRYGTFPSLSAGWRVSEEAFMREAHWIQDLKLRAGFGITGNSEIPRTTNWADEYVTNPGSTNYDLDGSQGSANTGYGISRFGNPNTKWETTRMMNFGADMAFFKGKLEASVEYYVKNTSDMLVVDSYSALAGAGTPPYVNLGNMQNKGWDFTINHRSRVGEVSYQIGANLATYKNKVVKLNNMNGTRFWGGGTRYGNVTMTENGAPISQFFGYQIAGFYESESAVTGYVGREGERQGKAVLPLGVGTDENLVPSEWVGKYIFEDVNGDGRINAEDKVVIGNPHPDFTGGMNMEASYKNFDLSAIFYGSYGNQIYNQVKWWTDFQSQEGNRSRTMLEKSWEPGKSGAVLPILDAGDNISNRDAHSYYVEDGSFLRLQVLSLGYTLPAGLLDRIKVKNCRLYLQANNLFTLTNYSGLDPEISNSSLGDSGDLTKGIDFGRWPQSRQFQAGLSLTF